MNDINDLQVMQTAISRHSIMDMEAIQQRVQIRFNEAVAGRGVPYGPLYNMKTTLIGDLKY